MSTAYTGRSAGDVRSDRDARAQGITTPALWLKKIEKARGESKREKWRADAEMAIAAYENGEIADKLISGANIFFANVATTGPAVFNAAPIPANRPRYGENPPHLRKASEVLERLASYDMDEHPFTAEIADAVRKALVVGEGQVRVRYAAEVVDEPLLNPDGSPVLDMAGKPVVLPRVATDRTWVETVPWDRYIVGPCRSFDRRPWEAFEHDMSEDEVLALNPGFPVTELGFTTARPYGARTTEGQKEPTPEPKGVYQTVTVYEIWDKASRSVLWVSPGATGRSAASGGMTDIVIQVHPDPYRLRNFFATPSPIAMSRRIDCVVPQVAYATHKPLFDEFERVSQRINKLIGQLKVAGLIDARLKADLGKLQLATDGEFFPAQNGDQFVSGGGLEKSVLFWPLDQIIAVIQQLVQHRESIKALIWEATGIADIMRGNSDPNETLGAQQMKAEWGSLRVKEMQTEVERFARDVIRLMIEVRANLTPWDLIKVTTSMMFTPTEDDIAAAMQELQASLPPPAEGAPPPDISGEAQRRAAERLASLEEQVAAVVKSPWRHLVIDIETGSTVRNEIARELDQFNKLLTATGTWAQAITAAIQIMPETREGWFELLGSQLDKFDLNQRGEAAIEKIIQAARAPLAQPNAPSPEQMQAEQMQADAEQQRLDADLKLKDMDLQIKAMDLEARKADAVIRQKTAAMDLDVRRQDVALKRETAALDADARRETAAMNREDRQAEREHAAEMGRMDADARRGDVEHRARLAAMKESSARNGVSP
jgi:hypothetical protein